MENVEPPDVTPVPPPDGWNEGVLPYLRAYGIIPRPFIPITSSMHRSASCDPFLFYLTYILGLAPSFRVSSKALVRGSWAHVRLEYAESPAAAVPSLMQGRLNTRLAEIDLTGEAWGLDRPTLDRYKEDETKSFKTAWAWFDALSDVRLPAEATGLSRPSTFLDYLLHPSLMCLGREIRAHLWVRLPNREPFLVSATFDRVYLNTQTNQLWIFDLKTCDDIPSRRLETVHFEFQTQHYLFILRSLLEGGHLNHIAGINAQTVVGGMCHLAMQKPSINFDRRVDRPFKFNEHVLKSGPRKGQIELRKEFLSEEPLFDLYVERCKRWYRGEGEYLEERAERVVHPPVNFSFSPTVKVLDEDGLPDYYSRLGTILDLCQKSDQPPGCFTRNARSLSAREGNDILRSFYLCTPRQWPEIVASNKMIQHWRDSDVTPNTSSGFYNTFPVSPT